MRNIERFNACLGGQKIDRTPIIEWASWWDKTVRRWEGEGIPKFARANNELNDYWGLDKLVQFWLPTRDAGCPQPKSNGAPLIESEEDYLKIRRHLFTAELLESIEKMLSDWADAHGGDDIATWFSLDGYFWFPRTLLGIENHLYAFYDYPELMLRINEDLTEYHLKCVKLVAKYLKPSFMTIAEDMSYNLGPMISREQYNEFMLPFYRRIIPEIKKTGARVLIDTDGQVEPLIPWFLDGGIEGILPLERMAGVDVNRIRENYHDFILIGGFDKTTMKHGEAAMRREFERILPAIKSGRYIPSVDHQTPPDVSVENYRVFLKLLREYAAMAAK